MGRAAVNQRIQVGVEVTQGTAVAANKLLPSLGFDFGPAMNARTFRQQGWKYPSSSRASRPRSEGTFDGPLAYEELPYLLSTVFGTAVITTPSGGTLSRQWLWTPAAQGPDTIKSLTIERGDDTAVEIVAGVVARGINLNYGADEITISGDMIGKQPTSGTFTGSPTQVGTAGTVAGPDDIDVFISTSLGALNATLYASKLTDAMAEGFSITGKVGPRYVHNTTYTSYKDLVELAPELSGTFASEHNAQSRALYDSITANPLQFIGVRTTGPIIEGSIHYLSELIYACNITAAKKTDTDGVWGMEYTAVPRYDSTLGSAFTFRLVNTLTAL
jgi:hypothetical protein